MKERERERVGERAKGRKGIERERKSEKVSERERKRIESQREGPPPLEWKASFCKPTYLLLGAL